LIEIYPCAWDGRQGNRLKAELLTLRPYRSRHWQPTVPTKRARGF